MDGFRFLNLVTISHTRLLREEKKQNKYLLHALPRAFLFQLKMHCAYLIGSLSTDQTSQVVLLVNNLPASAG